MVHKTLAYTEFHNGAAQNSTPVSSPACQGGYCY